MVRTTPPRPRDLTAEFPEVAALARPAVPLHPRRGTPTVTDSSIGGPLLWPADEPWPMCDEHIGAELAGMRMQFYGCTESSAHPVLRNTQ